MSIVDHFATLGVPRQPWLEDEEIRTRFHSLAVSSHPDAAGGTNEAFAQLNAAWQTLRAPAARLRHYLELTAPEELARPAQPPVPLADLFMGIAEVRQKASSLGSRLAETRSPLARAVLEPEKAALRAQLKQLQEQATAATESVHSILKGSATTSVELGDALQNLTYLEKWNAQLRELLHGLA